MNSTNPPNNKKDLKLHYKQNPPPMGIYQIKNQKNGKRFIGSSMNLTGKINSQRFQLELKCNFNRALQDDWNTFGPDAFTFDILETIDPEKTSQEDWQLEISLLKEKWLNELQPYGEDGYNKQDTD